MLRRPVYFMAGIYLGGNRYRVHFERLDPPAAANREDTVAALLACYVAALEGTAGCIPGGSTFLTSGTLAETDHAQSRTDLPCLPACCWAPCAGPGCRLDRARADAIAWPAKSGKATFVEKKYLAMLDQPLESSGELSFTADRLEKRTVKARA